MKIRKVPRVSQNLKKEKEIKEDERLRMRPTISGKHNAFICRQTK